MSCVWVIYTCMIKRFNIWFQIMDFFFSERDSFRNVESIPDILGLLERVMLCLGVVVVVVVVPILVEVVRWHTGNSGSEHSSWLQGTSYISVWSSSQVYWRLDRWRWDSGGGAGIQVKMFPKYSRN